MFTTKLFVLRNFFSYQLCSRGKVHAYFASKLSNDELLVISFINKFINNHNITHRGTWKQPREYNFEVGIGRFSGNKALATNRVHLEIEGNNLTCYDKSREQGKSYIQIHDTDIKDQICSKFADEIRKPGSGNLCELEKLIDQHCEPVHQYSGKNKS